MEKRKILYISQEISPYVADSHNSLRGRAVSQGVQGKGFEVRTFMPKYGSINERRNQLHEVIRLSGINIIIDDTDHPLIIKVATLQPTRMQVYFIDSDDYFSRTPLKELETISSPDDNDERSIFFVRGVVETVKKLRWAPGIIHCVGWISALTPMLLKRVYNDDPTFSEAKVVFSITGPEDLPAPLAPGFADKIKSDELTDGDLSALDGADEVGYSHLMRLGIAHSDGVVVSTPDVDPALVEYARSLGKPILDYQEDAEGSVDRYVEFYNSL